MFVPIKERSSPCSSGLRGSIEHYFLKNITTLIGIPMGLAILVYFYIQGKKHKEAKASASAAA